MAESREDLIERVARETGEDPADVRDILEALECCASEEQDESEEDDDGV